MTTPGLTSFAPAAVQLLSKAVPYSSMRDPEDNAAQHNNDLRSLVAVPLLSCQLIEQFDSL